MRRLGSDRVGEIEDQSGMVVHHPQEVTISSRTIGFLESRARPAGRLPTPRVAAWVALLALWVVFGKMIATDMGFLEGYEGNPYVRGIATPVPLTLEQAALVAGGKEVFDSDDNLVIDPARAAVHRLTVAPGGTMTLDGGAWAPGDVRRLCRRGEGRAVVVVWPAMSARYQDVVGALDGLVTDYAQPCRVDAVLVGAPRPPAPR